MIQQLHKDASLQDRVDCPCSEIYEKIKPDNEEVFPCKEYQSRSYSEIQG
jgi:hypothetical protein